MSATLELTFRANRARADANTMGEAKRAFGAEPSRVDRPGLNPLVGDLVKEVLTYPSVARTLWADFYTRAKAGEVTNYNEEGQRWARAFEAWLACCEMAQDLADELRGAGVNLQGAEQLPEVRQTLRRMQEQALAHWPGCDEAEVRQAVAQCERGEYKTLEEILRELPGGRH